MTNNAKATIGTIFFICSTLIVYAALELIDQAFGSGVTTLVVIISVAIAFWFLMRRLADDF